MPKSSKHIEEDLKEFQDIVGIQLYNPKTSFKTILDSYVYTEDSTQHIYPRVKPEIHRPNKFWSWLLRKFTTPSCIK